MLMDVTVCNAPQYILQWSLGVTVFGNTRCVTVYHNDPYYLLYSVQEDAKFTSECTIP